MFIYISLRFIIWETFLIKLSYLVLINFKHNKRFELENNIYMSDQFASSLSKHQFVNTFIKT